MYVKTYSRSRKQQFCLSQSEVHDSLLEGSLVASAEEYLALSASADSNSATHPTAPDTRLTGPDIPQSVRWVVFRRVVCALRTVETYIVHMCIKIKEVLLFL